MQLLLSTIGLSDLKENIAENSTVFPRYFPGAAEMEDDEGIDVYRRTESVYF